MGNGANGAQNGSQGPQRRPGQDRKPRGKGQDKRQRPAVPQPGSEPDAIPPDLGGRPKVSLTPKDYAQVEAMAGYGLTRPAIAKVLGIAVRTFERRMTDDPELVAALDRGLPVAEARIGQSLYALAVGEESTIPMVDDEGKPVMDPATGKQRRVRIYKRLPDLQSIKWWEQTRAGRREVVRQETVSVDDEVMTDEEVAAEVADIISLGAERVRRAQGG